jgi:flagellar biosynthesis protein FlhB
MAQQADRESRTEEPTEKKLLDELEKGNVPISREASVFAATLALLAIAAFLARDLMRSVGLTLERLSGDPSGLVLRNSTDAVSLLNTLVWEIGTPFIPMLVILLMAGLASSFLQHAPRIVFDRIPARLESYIIDQRLAPYIRHARSGRFFKGVCKLFSIGIVMWTVLRWQRSAFINTMSLDPDAIPDLILMIAMRLLMAVGVVTILLLAVDLIWVRMHWRRDMRMSKQEIKEEMKELEGDPLKKARLRSLALDRRRKSMIAAVPRATLVIANPTHYAIALRYVRERGWCPLGSFERKRSHSA